MLDAAAASQRAAAAHDLALQHRVQQSGSTPRRRSGISATGIAHLGQAGRERLAFLRRPEPGGAGGVVGGGEAFGRLDDGGQGVGWCDLHCRVDSQRRFQAGLEARQECGS